MDERSAQRLAIRHTRRAALGLLTAGLGTALLGCTRSSEPGPQGQAPDPTAPPSPTLTPAGTTMPTATPAPASARDERWREDLRYLARELPRAHVNLFFQLRPEEFQQAAARLEAAIPSLTDAAVIAGLARLVAMAGDGHTVLSPTQSATGFRAYPLRLFQFSDGMAVMRVVGSQRQALGGRVVRIGGRSLEEAVAAVTPLISHDNEPGLRSRLPIYLMLAEVLHAVGVMPDPEHGRFVVRDSAGDELALDLAPAALSAPVDWAFPVALSSPTAAPIYRPRRNPFYRALYLEGERTLFVQFDSYQDAQDQPFEAFAREVFALADSRPVERFVLDLRNNGGGNQALGRPLIDGITSRPAINARGSLFILVGRATYSSAVNDAVRYRRETQAVFVGEPTGGRPNHYGEVRNLTLPNSGLVVGYSTRFFRLQPEDTPYFAPDMHVEMSTADYLAGRDPAFEAVLAYR